MLEARPHAKVNLTLEVLGRRPDGYHELRSIFLRVGLSDRLTMKPAGPEATTDLLTVTGMPGTPTDGNLVLKALDALRGHARADFPPLDVTLDKRIPAAAGLGGGSGDAACALKIAQAAWGIRIPPDGEFELAGALGSDVPFFMHDLPAAAIEGRGERVEPQPMLGGEIGLLLITPPISLSTTAVFDRYDEIGTGRRARMAGNVLVEFDAEILRDANDLWPAASSLEPSLLRLREELERVTAVPWLMSGSGPTLFALYPSVGEAADAGQALVDGRMPELELVLINAVDINGPDPKWRHP